VTGRRGATGRRLLASWTVLVLVFLYLPLGVVVAYSFNANPDQVVIWQGFTTRWFPDVLADPVIREALATSLRIALANALIAAFLGTLGAVGLRFAPRWLSALYDGLAFATLTTPVLVLGIASLLSFVLLTIPRGSATILLAHVVFNSSIVLLVVRARLAGLGHAEEEAAADLGAGRWRVFALVTLPRLLPAIVAGGLLAFTYSWDDYVVASFVGGARTTTLPLRIFGELRFGISPRLNALATITLAVTLIGLAIALALARRTLRPRGVG
jgi:ABC-type spermidine/putrescine transport system permease subunit II